MNGATHRLALLGLAGAALLGVGVTGVTAGPPGMRLSQVSPTPSVAATETPTSTPGDTLTETPTGTPDATTTSEPPAETPTGTPTAVTEGTATASATPTEPGTALPPVAAGLLLDPSAAYAGGTVAAGGAGYDCGAAGIDVWWPGPVRLGHTAADPFTLILTLPPTVPPGAYAVTARCAAAGGRQAVVDLMVRAPPPPPVAAFEVPPGPWYVGQVLVPRDDSTAFATRRDWDFGDGSPPAHGGAVAHAYAEPGRYTIALTVFDGAGRAAVTARPVEVLEGRAAGRYTRQPDGRTVAFRDQSVGPFTHHRWEFGDGASSNQRHADHAYIRPGTFMPRLVASYPGPGGAPVVRQVELGPLVIGDASGYNLAITGLDLVQVNLADQFLAARRRTIARVHVRREGADDVVTAQYDVRLRARQADGTPLAGSPFFRRLRADADAVATRQDVVELELPQEWTLGRPRLVVDPDLGLVDVSQPITLTLDVRAINLREDNVADNVLTRPVTFQETMPLDLLLLPLAAADGSPGGGDLADLYHSLRQALPVPGDAARLWLPQGGRVLAVPDDRRSEAGAALEAANQAHRTAGLFRRTIRAVALSAGTGDLPAEPCDRATTAGGRGLWSAALAGPGPTGRRATAASVVHALAHQLGLLNAPGGLVADGPVDGAYPVPDGHLDGDGYEVATLVRRPAAESLDYLSHAACPAGRAWWSAYSYGRLVRQMAIGGGLPFGGGIGPLGAVGRLAALGDEPGPMASDYAAIGGIILPPGADGERVWVDPIFHSGERGDPADDGPGTGDWAIVLEDDAGRALFIRRLTVDFHLGSDGQPRPRAFFQVLPWHAFTRRVVVREASTVHWERPVPAAWPWVAVVEPSTGAVWEQERAYQVRWSAEDPAGLPLVYHVDLSPDDGQTWRPVGSTVVRTELTLPTAYLAGCQACRLRVRASNGLLMSEARSQPFAIAPPPPVVDIAAPADGAIVTANEPVWLEGVAYDHTDGPLVPGQVSWLSNRDGNLGFSPGVQTLLSVGRHTIRLTVINSAGRAGSDEITLRVVPARRDYTIWVPWARVPAPP